MDIDRDIGQHSLVSNPVRLRELLDEHVCAPFPDSVVKGESLGEVDVVMIGADISGWSLSKLNGGLTEIQTDRLRQAALELAKSLPLFPAKALPYYAQLLDLANEALA